MDIGSLPYSTGSHQCCLPQAPRSAMSTPPYLTPPQTRAHVSQMGGLDLLHCQSDQKVHAFTPSQGLLSTAVSWPSNTNSTQSYSNPVAKLGEYLHLGIYEGVDALPSHTSPFLSPHTTSTPSTMASLSSPMIREESAGLMRGLQRNTDLPLAASSEKTIKTMPHSKNISRTFPQANSSYEMPRFAPIETDPTPSNTLLELDNIIKREWCDGGVATQPVPDITSNPSNVTAMRISEVPKRFHKSITAISSKYGCPQCGMQFTRKSNCKSHIKIHDPNRKYSHQCTVTYCLKQFSRKTDLTRHIDSVHKKIRKFGCSQCGHHFARQDTLKRHCADGCRRQRSQSDYAPGVSSYCRTPQVLQK